MTELKIEEHCSANQERQSLRSAILHEDCIALQRNEENYSNIELKYAMDHLSVVYFTTFQIRMCQNEFKTVSGVRQNSVH